MGRGAGAAGERVAPRDLAGLNEFLYSEDVFAIVEALDLDTWLAGGCWICAEALRRQFGGELWMIHEAGQDQVEHVVCRLGDLYLDGDGASTEAELLRRWHEDEMMRAPRLAPFVPAKAGDILYDEAAASELAAKLATR